MPVSIVLTTRLSRNLSGEQIPHLYDGEKLCLFLPNAFEWSPTMSPPPTRPRKNRLVIDDWESFLIFATDMTTKLRAQRRVADLLEGHKL